MPNIYPNKVDGLALVAVAEPPTKGNIILSRLEQTLNALAPMLVTPLPISASLRFVQLEKAY